MLQSRNLFSDLMTSFFRVYFLLVEQGKYLREVPSRLGLGLRFTDRAQGDIRRVR